MVIVWTRKGAAARSAAEFLFIEIDEKVDLPVDLRAATVEPNRLAQFEWSYDDAGGFGLQNYVREVPMGAVCYPYSNFRRGERLRFVSSCSVASLIHVGAWSLVFSQPRTCRSTWASSSLAASDGLSRT
jgi:hypothetical protein